MAHDPTSILPPTVLIRSRPRTHDTRLMVTADDHALLEGLDGGGSRQLRHLVLVDVRRHVVRMLCLQLRRMPRHQRVWPTGVLVLLGVLGVRDVGWRLLLLVRCRLVRRSGVRLDRLLAVFLRLAASTVASAARPLAATADSLPAAAVAERMLCLQLRRMPRHEQRLQPCVLVLGAVHVVRDVGWRLLLLVRCRLVRGSGVRLDRLLTVLFGGPAVTSRLPRDVLLIQLRLLACLRLAIHVCIHVVRVRLRLWRLRVRGGRASSATGSATAGSATGSPGSPSSATVSAPTADSTPAATGTSKYSGTLVGHHLLRRLLRF